MSPARRNAAASVGPPSRNTCWRSRANSSLSAACGSRVRRCRLSAPSDSSGSKIRRWGSRSRSPITTRSGWCGQRIVVLVADRERRVVDGDGVGADEHHVAERPQPVGVQAGGGAGDPARGAVGGGAATVERGRELPGDEGALVVDGERPHGVELAGLAPGAVPRPRRPPRRARCPRRPAATGFGSGWANTTRRTPAAMSLSEQGPVRPVWLHGSSVTTAVVPRGGCRRPGPGHRPRRAACPPRGGSPLRRRVPSSSIRTQPTRGLGPKRHAGRRRELERAQHRCLLGRRRDHRAPHVRSRTPGPTARRSRPGESPGRSTSPACASLPDFHRRSRTDTWSTGHWL